MEESAELDKVRPTVCNMIWRIVLYVDNDLGEDDATTRTKDEKLVVERLFT